VMSMQGVGETARRCGLVSTRMMTARPSSATLARSGWKALSQRGGCEPQVRRSLTWLEIKNPAYER